MRHTRFTFMALASLASCFALCGDAVAAARHASGKATELVRQCTEVRGHAHIGPYGPSAQHFDMKLDLAVGGGGEGQEFTWRQTGPTGAFELSGYDFTPESVSCEAFAGGFVLRATGTSRFRLPRTDSREAGEEVLVEERLGSTTIAIGGHVPGGATPPPGPLPPLELPASSRGPAVTIEGPSGTLNHNSLHAL